jgi:hypothetical protein
MILSELVKAGNSRCDPQLIISLDYFYYHIYFQLLVELLFWWNFCFGLDILEPRTSARSTKSFLTYSTTVGIKESRILWNKRNLVLVTGPCQGPGRPR